MDSYLDVNGINTRYEKYEYGYERINQSGTSIFTYNWPMFPYLKYTCALRWYDLISIFPCTCILPCRTCAITSGYIWIQSCKTIGFTKTTFVPALHVHVSMRLVEQAGKITYMTLQIAMYVASLCKHYIVDVALNYQISLNLILLDIVMYNC